MNVFSKPIKEKNEFEISWFEFYKNNIELKKYKVPQLKMIAKYNDLYVSGTKPLLLLRITSHFHRTKCVIKIQSLFRKYLVSVYFKIRDKKTSCKLCVNDTDFYTMDSLNEIPFYDFFSYTDKQGFTYGFHIHSLVSLFKNGGIFINPYNRENFDISIIRNLSSIIRLNRILFKNKKIYNLDSLILDTNENIINITQNEDNILTNISDIRHDTLHKLDERRTRSLYSRIEEVFMEIDFLGNYTQSSWFSRLNYIGCTNFIQYLIDIWNYRSDMSMEIRSQICPFFNPFYYRVFNLPTHIDNGSIIQHRALTVMENIVFSGGDVEYRKLGIIHILTALTLVSSEARYALPWLYESAIF
jgi:hypothetical protein